MIRFQADADLHRPIVLAVKKQEPAIDFVTADDSGLKALADPEVLEFAANSGRILVTHDLRTMPHHFHADSKRPVESWSFLCGATRTYWPHS